MPSVFISRYFWPLRILANYASYAVLCALHIKNFHEAAALLLGAKAKASLEFRDGTVFAFSRESFKRPLYLLLMAKHKGYAIAPAQDFSSAEFLYAGKKISLHGPDSLGLAYDISLKRNIPPSTLQVRQLWT